MLHAFILAKVPLEGLASACARRAADFERTIEREPDAHPSVLAMRQNEIEFFEDASENIELAVDSLKTEWEDREPTAAHGRYWETPNRYVVDAVNQYFRGLLETMDSPTASKGEKQRAASLIAKEGDGTIWIDRATGKPDFEMARLFREVTATLVATDSSAEEKQESLELLKDFYKRQDALAEQS